MRALVNHCTICNQMIVQCKVLDLMQNQLYPHLEAHMTTHS